MTATALEAQGITVGYPGKEVLRDVDVRIPRGRCVALLGRNGAGKSTLLRTLSGIQPPLKGRVSIEGREIASMGSIARGKILAYLPQQVSPEIPFTVFEIVLMGRYPHRGLSMFASEADRKVVRSVIERTGLSELADKRCTELSGGEFQRVLVASVLAQDPRVMLLDEPTASLDLEYRSSIMTMVGEGEDPDRTVVVATHDLNLAAAHCSFVVALDGRGNLVDGSADEVLTEDVIEDVFGVQVKTVEVDLPDGASRRQFVVVS